MKIKVTDPYTNAKTVWEMSSYVSKSIEDRGNDAPGKLEAMEWQTDDLRRTLSYLIQTLAERDLLTLADVREILCTNDKLEK